MMASFDPGRAEAIERALVAHVARHPHRRHRSAWAAGLLVAGAVAGAGASAGAFAASGMLQPAGVVQAPTGQPTPDLPDAVTAPAGVTPGMPVVSLLDEPVSVAVDTTTEVPLAERPDDATHARVTVTATRPGALSWGTDPGGNNPTATWTATDVAAGPSRPTWYDFPLDDSVEALYLDPTDFSGVVTVQFVAHLPTLFGVNADGQTYGSSSSSQGEPDLVAVEATNGKTGYVYRAELDDATGDTAAEDFTSPEDALEWQEDNRGATHTLTVYLSDGLTEIGEFQVGGP